MGAVISATGQWTNLATVLTPYLDTAKPTVGSIGSIAPADLQVPTFPSEVLAFIQLAAQGFAASQIDGAAITVGTTHNLDTRFTALFLRVLLDAYLQKGLPGHDQIAARGL